MRMFLATVIALGFVVYAAAIEVGDECPALDRPEVVTEGGGYGAWVNVDDYLAAEKTFLVSFGYDTWGYCNNELEDIEDYVYYDYYPLGVEFLEVDCWDTPAEIGNWKFNMLDGNPVRFLDGEGSDWTAWKKSSSGVPQTFIIGQTGYCYLSKLGYGSGTYTQFIDTFEDIIYGDDDPPYVDGLNPDDGETGVDLDDNIKGHVKDDTWGVDEESVVVEASVFSRDDIEGTLTLTGDFFNFTYTLNPDDDLPHYAEIFVYVAADDLAGHDVEYEYSFSTRSFELQEPDDGEVFDVTGPRSGGEAGRVATTGTVPVIADGGGRSDFDVTFEWEEVVRADSYELLVDDNDDFSSPEVHETGIADTEYTHTFDVTDDVTYYWYVVCNAPDDDFDSADVFSFEFDYNTNVAPASLGHIKAGFAE